MLIIKFKRYDFPMFRHVHVLFITNHIYDMIYGLQPINAVSIIFQSFFVLIKFIEWIMLSR